MESEESLAGEWTELPPAPLAPRRSAHALWVGDRLLVMGGTDAPPCPPNADCIEPTEAPFRDGAAYDPATKTWRPIAEAPVPLGYASTAVVGDRAYFLLGGFGSSHPDVRAAFLAYDAATDRWRELAMPRGKRTLMLAGAGTTLIAYHSTHEIEVLPDLVYDPESDSWSELPPDPLGPSFDRTIVQAGSGLVLFGIELVPNPGAESPSLYRAALFDDGVWKRLPDSEVVGWNPIWWAVDGRVINPTIERLDGGEVNNWRRSYPAGGTLDVTDERWIELPDPPGEPGEFTGIYAAGDRYMVGGQGLVFDAKEGRWTNLPRPTGGPDGEAAATWTDAGLVVWGGVRWKGSEGALVGDGWVWQPAE